MIRVPAWIRLTFFAVLLVFLGWVMKKSAQAQSVVPPITIQSSQPHTACTVTPSTTSFCFASDGLYQSVSGAPYIQLTPGGVISVNGKTGVVTINASTTATTTLQ